MKKLANVYNIFDMLILQKLSYIKSHNLFLILFEVSLTIFIKITKYTDYSKHFNFNTIYA